MTKTIHFELVSPEQKLVSEPVGMAVIPAAEGEMGVGADHAAFVVALKPGVVRLYDGSGAVTRKIFIAGGFADVTGEQCSVLAEEAVNVNDLDKAELMQELEKLQQDLSLTDTLQDQTKVQEKIDIARAKISAIAA